MTGFGRSTLELKNTKLSIEIKSLNSKNIDINTRITSSVKPYELEIRKLLASKLKRGKIDFILYSETINNKSSANLNPKIIHNYIDQLREIVDGNPVELLKIAVKMPETLVNEIKETDQSEWLLILKHIKLATQNIIQYRLEEGKALEKDFIKQCDKISYLLSRINKMDSKRIKKVKLKLTSQLEGLKIDIDKNRFEQELIYYIEKFDINEEKVRLENHLKYFQQILKSKHPNGKKLGFICQEMGREINTIGSKANSHEIQKIVIDMKDELEKIKEQLLNVL